MGWGCDSLREAKLRKMLIALKARSDSGDMCELPALADPEACWIELTCGHCGNVDCAATGKNAGLINVPAGTLGVDGEAGCGWYCE